MEVWMQAFDSPDLRLVRHVGRWPEAAIRPRRTAWIGSESAFAVGAGRRVAPTHISNVYVAYKNSVLALIVLQTLLSSDANKAKQAMNGDVLMRRVLLSAVAAAAIAVPAQAAWAQTEKGDASNDPGSINEIV